MSRLRVQAGKFGRRGRPGASEEIQRFIAHGFRESAVWESAVAMVVMSLCLVLPMCAPAQASYFPNVWFSGTRLIFDHAEQRSGALAVGITDEGLRRFLSRTGAVLSYQSGQRYVVVTTADHRTVSFTLGDARYSAEGVSLSAPFAPYVAHGEPFLPLYALAKAMYVLPVETDGETVLQPQIAALDVHAVGKTVLVTVRGATPLRYRRISAADADRVVLQFQGTASTLEQSRVIGAPGLSQITLLVEGTPRAPKTTVAFEAPAGGVHAMYTSPSSNAFTAAFAPSGTTLSGTSIPDEGAVIAVAPVPTPLPTVLNSPVPLSAPTPSSGAVVTAVEERATGREETVHIVVSGSAAYEWHRLLDNRWYVDIRDATLGLTPEERTDERSAVVSLRMKQLGEPSAPIVRIALTTASMRRVTAVPANDGLNVVVGGSDEDDQAVHIGYGRVGPDASVAVNPQAPAPAAAVPPPGGWKFGGRGSGGGRVIVLDPGHGGSDSGAQQNGLTEKVITLDVAQRLRTLLIARGWDVRMTRQSDVDVFSPNDSAHDELQARCDIANNAGARLFVSIHVNSFTSAELNGTTTYYYKDEDHGLADAVHHRLTQALDTRDDGVRKANFYVIRHTTMPAILVETAFLSNPGDAELLRSSAFLQKIALAVADGVGDYIGSPSSSMTSMIGQ